MNEDHTSTHSEDGERENVSEEKSGMSLSKSHEGALEREETAGLSFVEEANTDERPLDCALPVAVAYVMTLSSEYSRASMRSGFVRAARMLFPGARWEWKSASRVAWYEMTIETATLLRATLSDEVERGTTAPQTAARILSAIRGALRQAWLCTYIDRDALERLNEALRNIRGSRPPCGRHVSNAELAALFASLSKSTDYASRRDAAAFALMRSPALRRAEVCAANYEDLSEDATALRVHGKGSKIRIVHLTNGTLEAMRDFLAVRGNEPGPLFASVQKGGAKRAERLSVSGLHVALRARRRKANLSAFSCHDLRRTFAGDALSSGVDLATLQAIMGHASPVTTSRYDRRPEEARRSAMASISIPYASVRKKSA
jgi:integrase